MGKVPLNITIEEEFKQLIFKAAAVDNITVTAWVITAINAKLKEQKEEE